MPTRNVSLTDHFDQFVEKSVNSGRYLNASEVVREGLRLLEQKAQEDRLKLERLREAAAAGFDAIDRGRFCEIRGSAIGRTIAEIGKRAAARAPRNAG
jgi:antitoxin ParD1/3/4